MRSAGNNDNSENEEMDLLYKSASGLKLSKLASNTEHKSAEK
jgi:hypothetical protein